MSDLTGQLISNTYKQVILVSSSTSNTGVNTSLKAVQTGDGTNTALKVATNAVQITGALGVTGNVSLDANLHVDDKVCASAFYGDGSNLSGVTASVGGNISVSNATIGGNLYVSGTATVVGATHLQSTVSVGGAAQFGSTVTVSGAAQLQSTVTAVGAATFKSTVTVENAAILKNNVSVGGTFAAAGAATFTSKTEFNNDVSVSGRFDVASSVCVGGIAKFASDVSVSGNLNVVNNVTAAFFYGDGSNLTNVEAELGVATNISVSGFIHAGGSVSVSGPFNVVGAATFKSNVSVSGNSNFTGTVTVGGAVSLASSLSVGGAANFANTVTVAGAVSLASTLSVGGAANFASTVTIAGTNLQATNAQVCASAYYGDGSNLTNISGAAISGNISVNNATVGGNLYIGGTVTAVGAAIFNSTVTVSGNATFKTNVSVSGNTNLGGTVTVAGAASLASTLSVGGAANFASTVTIAGATSVGGTLNVGGNVGIKTTSPGGDLHVQGDAANAVRLYLTDGDATGTGNSLLISKSGTTSFVSDRQAGSSFWFGTADTERMRIDSSGNVGIGTTSPSYLLDLFKSAATVVRIRNSAATGATPSTTHGEFVIESTDANMGMQFLGSTTSNQKILFGDTDSGGSGQIYYNHTSNYMALYTSASEAVRIDSSGNVGIGTASPTTPLTVAGKGIFSGAGSFEALELITSDANRVYVTGNSSVNGDMWRLGTSSSNPNLNIDALQSNGEILLRTGGTNERMRIDENGNVGVGTATPDRLFEVDQASGDAFMRFRASDTGGGADTVFENLVADNGQNNYIYFGDLDDTNIGIIRYSHASDFMSFTINASERMRIDSSGRLLVGSTSITSSLGAIATFDGTVYSDTENRAANPTFAFAHDNFSSDGNNFIMLDRTSEAMRFNVAGSERLRITSGGDVGIGTTSPAKQLHITKAAKADIGLLTDSATITPNFDAKQNFIVTLGGNRTLANPTNADAGQTGSIFVLQDATGGRTLSFGANWKFAGGTAPTLSTGANAVDRIDYIVKSSTEIHAAATLNLS